MLARRALRLARLPARRVPLAAARAAPFKLSSAFQCSPQARWLSADAAPVTVEAEKKETKKGGFMSRLRASSREKLASREAEKKDDDFSEQLRLLADRETMTLTDFLDYHKEMADKSGATGWRSKVPFVGGREGTEELKKFVAQVEKFLTVETDPERIDAAARLRMAEAGGTGVDSVNQVLRQYEHMHVLHGRLRQVQAEGKPLPASQDELEDVFAGQQDRRHRKKVAYTMKRRRRYRRYKG